VTVLGRCAIVVVGALAMLAVALAWQSRTWPLIHDAPILHYIASRIGDGAVPYRDLFDMNQPGAYLLHLAVVRVLGTGDLAWRVVDLGWLALTCAAIAAYAAPFGRLGASGAAALFAAYHLAGGAWQAGQRDFFLCLFLVVAAIGVATFVEQPRRGSRALVSGAMALGAGMTLKPHAAVFAAALAVPVVLGARRSQRVVRPLGLYSAGLALAPAAVVAWLGAHGALGAWRAIVVDYLVPLYSRLGRPDDWQYWRWELWVVLGLAVAASVAAAARDRDMTPRLAIALLGVAYGLVHFFGQRKGWEYHLYPLAAFTAIVAFAPLERLIIARRRVLAGVMLVVLTVAGVLLALRGADTANAAWIRDKEELVRQLVADLRAEMRPGDEVQVLDTAEGGAHALLRLGTREPTRFVYDFHFFHDVDHPTIRALRAEFVRDLDARPPRLMVLFERGWPDGQYDRVARFPELAERLARSYTEVRRRPGYMILAKRHDP
jgi:hypothetical protein